MPPALRRFASRLDALVAAVHARVATVRDTARSRPSPSERPPDVESGSDLAARVSRTLAGSPARIALTYAAFGVLWVVATDRLLIAAVTDFAAVQSLQTIKGWAFVGFSTGVVYALAYYGRRDLEGTNERLDDALRQNSILHRVLQHDLRNACSAILGYAEFLESEVDGEASEALTRLEAKAEELVDLSEKATVLRAIAVERQREPRPVDLVETIETQVERVRDTYPDADVRLDFPEALAVETDANLGLAIYELLENAVEHGGRPESTVRVDVHAPDDGDGDLAGVDGVARSSGSGPDRVTIDVADDGPGVPSMEREVLGAALEDPTRHSTGLGLWIARTVVENAGGDLVVLDDEPRGTIVRLSLPTTPPPD